jgi:hypothetical protein
MTFTIEVLLRETDRVVAETVHYDGPEPRRWTDDDVASVLRSMLLAVNRVQHPEEREDPPISLRGISWIVTPWEHGSAIAIEIPSAAVVAGPFDVEQQVLDRLIGRVMGGGASRAPVH